MRRFMQDRFEKADVREMFFLKSIQMVEGSGVHWFAGVLQSLCSPS
jgi:hypothetical protein